MMSKCMIFFVLAVICCTNAGVLPAAYVAPYASSYNAHVVNHAIAAPLVAAAPAPIFAAHAPTVYAAGPAFLPGAAAAYSALPFF